MRQLSTTEPENRAFVPVGGIMWCVTHSGVADELDQYSDECDFNDVDDLPCDLKELYYSEVLK